MFLIIHSNITCVYSIERKHRRRKMNVRSQHRLTLLKPVKPSLKINFQEKVIDTLEPV